MRMRNRYWKGGGEKLRMVKIVVLAVCIIPLGACVMGALITAAALNELRREVSNDE